MGLERTPPALGESAKAANIRQLARPEEVQVALGAAAGCRTVEGNLRFLIVQKPAMAHDASRLYCC